MIFMSLESLLQDFSNGVNYVLISSIAAEEVARENNVPIFCLVSADQK